MFVKTKDTEQLRVNSKSTKCIYTLDNWLRVIIMTGRVQRSHTVLICFRTLGSVARSSCERCFLQFTNSCLSRSYVSAPRLRFVNSVETTRLDILRRISSHGRARQTHFWEALAFICSCATDDVTMLHDVATAAGLAISATLGATSEWFEFLFVEEHPVEIAADAATRWKMRPSLCDPRLKTKYRFGDAPKVTLFLAIKDTQTSRCVVEVFSGRLTSYFATRSSWDRDGGTQEILEREGEDVGGYD